MTTKTPIAPGNRHPHTVPATHGRVVVTLANNTVETRQAWYVEVLIGGIWNADSHGFDGPTAETDARTHARDMVRKHHAAAVEARREELRRYLAEQDQRAQRGMHDRAGVKAAEAELAELEGDDIKALRDRLRAQFNNLNEAA